ncbi:hypothetical protein B0A48_12124 [Cryoendolithus antarcticus]|uniref:Bromo domain-containing protein n=1 Tax=Cryoendolithus antarcticus TaxID=1507870 RepID=A0A1V8STW5_9PEZI|nr:hypothetical protein B0A48_12124 [Cryoendolithus antarcticus]
MALTLREQYIKLQRDRETAAAELQRQFDEQDAELKRKETQEADLRAQREEVEITLSRCDDDEASTNVVLHEAHADFAAIQERHESLCAKLNQKLDAIAACRGEAEEAVARTARSMERLYEVEGPASPKQPGETGPAAEAPNDAEPSMPALQQHFLHEVLAALKHNKAFEAFRYPVTLSFKARRYEQVIKKPMDLTTLGANLVLQKYCTTAEFEADFDLIEANACLYNLDDIAITGAADRMQSRFRFLMKHLPPVDPDVEDQTSICDSEDDIAVHGLPPTLSTHPTSAAPELDVPSRSDGRLSGPQHVRRRPLSTDKEWSVTPARWAELGDVRQRILTHVGCIMETAEGEDAAESCKECKAKGRECKVYKESVRQDKFKRSTPQGFVKRRLQEEAQLTTLHGSLEATIEVLNADEARLLLERNDLYAALAMHQEQVHAKAAEIDQAMDAAKIRRDGDEQECRKIVAQIERLQTSALMQAVGLADSDDSVAGIAGVNPTGAMPIGDKILLQRQLTALRYHKISERFVWPETGMSPTAQVVEKPMYLVMLEHKLCHDKYADMRDFVNDFKLIATNARNRYGDDHDLTHAAMKTQEILFGAIEVMPAPDKVLEDGEVQDTNAAATGDVNIDAADTSMTLARSADEHDPTAGNLSRFDPPRTLYRSIRIGRQWTISPKQWDKLSEKRRSSIDRARSMLDTSDGKVATKACEGCKAHGFACMVFRDHVRRERFAMDETCALACGRCRMVQARCSLQDDKSAEVTASQPESGVMGTTMIPPQRSEQGLETGAESNSRKRKRTPSQSRGSGEA